MISRIRRDSRVLRTSPIGKRNVVVIQSERACFRLLRSGTRTRAAKIDDGIDAEIAKSTETAVAWLTAAIQSFTHLLKSRQLSVAGRILSSAVAERSIKTTATVGNA